MEVIASCEVAYDNLRLGDLFNNHAIFYKYVLKSYSVLLLDIYYSDSYEHRRLVQIIYGTMRGLLMRTLWIVKEKEISKTVERRQY
jgi:hypothetical protein